MDETALNQLNAMIAAMNDYNDAKAELARCVKSCERDAGYFCAREYTEAENALAYFGEKLNEYIDARVAAALARAAEQR